jgi:hypothetical protein
MANPKNLENLSEALAFRPWFIPDPGPPWYFDVFANEREVQVQLVINQLQSQREILSGLIKGVDAQIALLQQRAGAAKSP